MQQRYIYGMRLRPYGIGCQPSGATLLDEQYNGYWSVIAYDHKLSERELFDYELDFIYQELTFDDYSVKEIWDRYKENING